MGHRRAVLCLAVNLGTHTGLLLVGHWPVVSWTVMGPLRLAPSPVMDLPQALLEVDYEFCPFTSKDIKRLIIIILSHTYLTYWVRTLLSILKKGIKCFYNCCSDVDDYGSPIGPPIGGSGGLVVDNAIDNFVAQTGRLHYFWRRCLLKFEFKLVVLRGAIGAE